MENLMEGCDFFAVYDGHSGDEVANSCKSMLYRRIQEALVALGPAPFGNRETVITLLKKCFIEHNKYLASIIDTLNDSGSTATVALITPKQIYLAYIGDSPCIMIHPRTGHILYEMGRHEPSLAVETARIQAAGGTVEIDEYGIPRVDGMLAVARAFGDFSFNWKGKVPPAGADWTKMKVTAHPDVVVWDRPDAGVLAIMSDGLVETTSAGMKPLAQVGHDIQKSLGVTEYNLKNAADAMLKGHMRETYGSKRYGGDDLSMILVDVGTGLTGGAENVAIETRHVKPPTRKAKGRRRLRTAKQNRLIKIFSC